MTRAVCPGSFDPVTNGHLDIASRTAGLFDEVVVAVLVNDAKQGLFSVPERIELLQAALAERSLDNVSVVSFSGLLVDFCRDNSVDVIVKGLRAVSDFGSEVQMAQMNQRLTGVDTLLLPATPEWSFVASSLVKEIARRGGDIAGLVPQVVLDALHRRHGATS
jgi:pantetheine-phosphate adenylyltransferase